MSDQGSPARKPAVPSLATLRTEIDRIDEQMHQLLIERGEIIESLIRVKGTQETGAAFRPAREAAMMRRLVERHRGILPLDTAESIWRVIISTFTYVQANYSVHADMAAGDAFVRDSARFHFGFTTPLVPHMSASAVVTAVAASRGDLGLVPAATVTGSGNWWKALEDEGAPKIIARLPFVERDDHPASLPLFVVSKPLVKDAAVEEVAIWSFEVDGWKAAAAGALPAGTEVLVFAQSGAGRAALLVSLNPGASREACEAALKAAGVTVRHAALVGGHASRYTVSPGK
ncbi:MAG TPA: chorismate mutase [Xanthobacteraceae bacterium]|jgi:chorismate mutase|nr:chorismate mutase [Xanthobacteraceae bacterium]